MKRTRKEQPVCQDVARHYDELDVFYRELWGEHVHHGLWLTGKESAEAAVEQLVERVAVRAAVGPGSSVCDAGSGYGAAARSLAARGASVTAVTVSAAQHAYARQVTDGRDVTYVLGDFLSHPFPAGAYDAIIAIESTEHMEDQAQFFRRAHELLKPGGRLVVCAWLSTSDARPWQTRFLLASICREGRLTALLTGAQYTEMAERVGLQVLSLEDLSRNVRRTWLIAAGRLVKALATESRYRGYLLDPRRSERTFVRAIGRMVIAYYTGALRYGMLTAQKPSG